MKAQNQDPPGQRREYDADVVIVGLGPVGAMTANLLGQAGVKTLVLERDVMPHTLPRAGATDDEVIRIFQSAGLADELLPLLDLGQSTMFLSAQGDPLVTMRPSGARNAYPQLAFFYQPDIERLLRAGLERYPHVSVQMGVRGRSNLSALGDHPVNRARHPGEGFRGRSRRRPDAWSNSASGPRTPLNDDPHCRRVAVQVPYNFPMEVRAR